MVWLTNLFQSFCPSLHWIIVLIYSNLKLESEPNVNQVFIRYAFWVWKTDQIIDWLQSWELNASKVTESDASVGLMSKDSIEKQFERAKPFFSNRRPVFRRDRLGVMTAIAVSAPAIRHHCPLQRNAHRGHSASYKQLIWHKMKRAVWKA